jgi:hypothetical protein
MFISLNNMILGNGDKMVFYNLTDPRTVLVTQLQGERELVGNVVEFSTDGGETWTQNLTVDFDSTPTLRLVIRNIAGSEGLLGDLEII